MRAGFADPVQDSQAVFRAVMDAFSRPGTVHRVGCPTDPPPPLHRATAAVLLALADAETPLWLCPAAALAQDWIAFHCGAPLVPKAAAAVGLAVTPLALDGFQTGTDEQPELGATLILQIEALNQGRTLTLSGPGLATPLTVRVAGLAGSFVADWARNAALFPRGVDVVLCAEDRLAALPRTVQIQEA